MKQLFFDILLLAIVTIVRYFAIAGTFFLVFYKWLSNKLATSKLQLRKASTKDFLREIWHSSVSSIMISITAGMVLVGPLRPYTFIYSGIHEYPLWWLPVSLVLALIIHDTYFYWMHRALHHDRIFRFAHLEHHRSTNPSPWASYSFHAIEAVLEGAIIIILAFVLPIHPYVILAFTFISFFINVYGHLGYEIMPKGFRKSIWFGIINTSCYYNLHHRKFKGNYSLYFRFWDKLLKTEHPDYVKEYDLIQKQRFG